MAGGEKNHLFQFPALHSGERELEGNLTLTNCIFPTRNFLDGWMAKKYISWAQTKLNRQTWFRTWLIIRSRRKKHPINARKIPHIFFASEHERKCLAETRQVLPPKTKTCSFPQTKCTSCILLSLLLRPTCIVRPQREVKGKKESLQILRDNRPPTKKKEENRRENCAVCDTIATMEEKRKKIPRKKTWAQPPSLNKIMVVLFLPQKNIYFVYLLKK